MDFQVGFNIALAIISALGGWVLKVLHESLRDLTEADSRLTTKVQAIEVLVAGHYIPRHEFESKLDAMFNKLDRIENLVITAHRTQLKD